MPQSIRYDLLLPLLRDSCDVDASCADHSQESAPFTSRYTQDDPSTGLRVKPEDLFNAFQKLTDENLGVGAGTYACKP